MKYITPMQRLKTHINDIVYLANECGFKFKQLHKRDKTYPDWRFRARGRSAIDIDCVYIIHDSNLNRYNPNKKSDQQSFGISFDYEHNPEKPTIIFSVKHSGEKDPTYSDRLNIQDAKRILSTLRARLNKLEEKGELTKHNILDEVELYFFDVKSKEELKDKVLENKDKLKPLITQYLEEESSLKELEIKVSENSNSIKRETINLPESEELRDIDREIEKLNQKKLKLQLKIKRKNEEIANKHNISSLKDDVHKKTCQISEINKKIKRVSQKAGISKGDLEQMIDTERNRSQKKLRVRKNTR